MNRQRRKKIDMCLSRLKRIKSEVEKIHEEEQDYFDRVLHGNSFTPLGSKTDRVCCEIDWSIDEIQNSIESLERAKL